MSKFATVVEELQELSSNEKEEILFLLNKYLAEGKRNDIFKNYLESRKRKNLKFSGNINVLKARLND